MRNQKEKLYYYAKANQMVDHRFNDDVAICWAKTSKQAWTKFRYLYKNCMPEDILEVKNYIPGIGVAILTDY